jgi:hypothetical protein
MCHWMNVSFVRRIFVSAVNLRLSCEGKGQGKRGKRRWSRVRMDVRSRAVGVIDRCIRQNAVAEQTVQQHR